MEILGRWDGNSTIFNSQGKFRVILRYKSLLKLVVLYFAHLQYFFRIHDASFIYFLFYNRRCLIIILADDPVPRVTA